MCGICGVRRFGAEPISRDMVDLLILNQQNRGLEAAGVAIQQANGEVFVHKQDVTPYEFVSSRDYDNFMLEHLDDEQTIAVLGHARKATQGSPRVNNNNHPMFQGHCAVVHNGVLRNDDWVFKECKLERKAETDSDVIRAVFDKEGFSHKAINMLSRLTGNAAFAAVSQDFPGKLMLGRSGNPIEIAGTKDFLIFSSEKGPLYKALRPFKRVFGITMRAMTPIDYCMIGMTDNSAWLIGDRPKEATGWEGDWVEWHQEMKIAFNFTPINYACHAQFHGQRVKFYDERPFGVMECPGCKFYIRVTPEVQAHLADYMCTACGMPLDKEKK